MIGFVRGTIAYIEEGLVVVDVNGIGMNVNISASTMLKLPGIGQELQIFTYTNVREDAINLYGFLKQAELKLFKQCISVSGIGPKVALSILSVMDCDDLRLAILAGDAKKIAKAPGIGVKTAERLILELKDKLQAIDTSYMPIFQSDTEEQGMEADIQEAVDALVALGYSRTDSVKALRSIENAGSMDTGRLLKLALKKLL